MFRRFYYVIALPKYYDVIVVHACAVGFSEHEVFAFGCETAMFVLTFCHGVNELKDQMCNKCRRTFFIAGSFHSKISEST